MNRDEFMRKKYSEIDQLKNLMKVYPADYIDSIISVLNKVTEELIEYLEDEKDEIEEEIIEDYEEEKKQKKDKSHKHKNKKKVHELNESNKLENKKVKNRNLRKFTMREIKKCNGKDGKPAYIVINGSVYDVGDSCEWINGKHYGVEAGRDLTTYYNMCHKSEEKIIEKIRCIGTLIEE